MNVWSWLFWQARRSFVLGLPLVFLLCGTASAEQPAPDQAELLFVAGKAKLAEKDYAQACKLFSASFGADPATGTLLALAICQERAGKLASAVRSYTEVALRSEREQRRDRARAAAERVAALTPLLSGVRMDLAFVADIVGLAVRIDGALVEPGKLNGAIPMDGGPHTVEVSAPTRRAWAETLTLANSSDEEAVVVPVLTPQTEPPNGGVAPPPHTAAAPAPATKSPNVSAAGAPLTAAAVPNAEAAPAEEAPAEIPEPTLSGPVDASTGARGLSTVQAAGVVTLTAGLLGFASATVFTLRAVHDNDASRTGCHGDVCTAGARTQRLNARQAGDIATVSFVLGSGLVGAGVLMYLLGRRDPATSSADTGGSLRASVAPWFSATGLGAIAEGTF